MFANKYIHRNGLVSAIKELPDSALGITVVIPCYIEPEIKHTLNSLLQCCKPLRHVEVIVLINHSETASEEIRKQNEITSRELEQWISEHSTLQLRFFVVGPVSLRKKWAGAGLARKYGMDEAVMRFNYLNNPHGIIVSLDADTVVEENYFTEIENYFRNNQDAAGATLHFSHQTEGLENKHLQGIYLYEKYMAYYRHALGYTGYPYPMFTLGSAFAVRADAYVRRGGMNRRKAGEDFYFLQNLVQVGKVGEIKTTAVHPSARLSDRVPFGTGPVLQKWMDGEEDIRITYNFEAFADLKLFFNRIESLYLITSEEYEKLLSNMPVPVKAFLKEDNFFSELLVLNRNCATIASFKQRFFYTFNAFKILKYLNFTHSLFYKKGNIDSQIEKLNIQ